jgi:hypothetical protein
MNPSPSDELRARVEQLVAQMLDGNLSAAEQADLLRAIDENAEACDLFVRQIAMHAVLREEVGPIRPGAFASELFGVRPDEMPELTAGIPSNPIAPIAPTAEMPESHPLLPGANQGANAFSVVGNLQRFLSFPGALFTLGTLLLGSVIGWSLHREHLPPAAAAPTPNESPTTPAAVTPVAYLAAVNGCNWGTDSVNLNIGNAVQTGDVITLYEGMAEFRLSSGVSLNVEGPAALVMASPTSLALQHGRVTVYVPWSAGEFRMVAGSCQIAASEAEFGVRVAGGKVDVHSFLGKIVASPALQDNYSAALDVDPTLVEREEDLPVESDFRKTLIASGRGLELSNQDDSIKVSQWHPANEAEFATKLSMAGPLPITRKYVNAVLKSKPLGYWRFEGEKKGLVANELEQGPGLTVVGRLNFVGGAGNSAVELGRPGSNGVLFCTRALSLPDKSDYSVEVWMKPSHQHNGGLVGMVVQQPAQSRDLGAFCLLTTRTGSRLRYMHRDPPGIDPKVGTNCISTAHYRVRRWQHVVAVKRGPEMEIYLDSVLVGSSHDETSLAKNLCLIVGELNTKRRELSFVGQLDELAIYSHALQPEEIVEHVKAVRWEHERDGNDTSDEI